MVHMAERSRYFLHPLAKAAHKHVSLWVVGGSGRTAEGHWPASASTATNGVPEQAYACDNALELFRIVRGTRTRGSTINYVNGHMWLEQS